MNSSNSHLKTLLAGLLLFSVGLSAYEQDITEKTYICKKKHVSYLALTSNNPSEGRAMWVMDYNDMLSDETYMLPIHDKKVYKNSKEINVFMTRHFGTKECVEVDVLSVEQEFERQSNLQK